MPLYRRLPKLVGKGMGRDGCVWEGGRGGHWCRLLA